MKRLSIFIVFTLIFLLLPCCSSYRYGAGEENVQKSNLTFGVVKSKIIKGQTTQEEILAIFGAPNMVQKINLIMKCGAIIE